MTWKNRSDSEVLKMVSVPEYTRLKRSTNDLWCGTWFFLLSDGTVGRLAFLWGVVFRGSA